MSIAVPSLNYGRGKSVAPLTTVAYLLQICQLCHIRVAAESPSSLEVRPMLQEGSLPRALSHQARLCQPLREPRAHLQGSHIREARVGWSRWYPRVKAPPSVAGGSQLSRLHSHKQYTTLRSLDSANSAAVDSARRHCAESFMLDVLHNTRHRT